MRALLFFISSVKLIAELSRRWEGSARVSLRSRSTFSGLIFLWWTLCYVVLFLTVTMGLLLLWWSSCCCCWKWNLLTNPSPGPVSDPHPNDQWNGQCVRGPTYNSKVAKKSASYIGPWQRPDPVQLRWLHHHYLRHWLYNISWIKILLVCYHLLTLMKQEAIIQTNSNNKNNINGELFDRVKWSIVLFLNAMGLRLIWWSSYCWRWNLLTNPSSAQYIHHSNIMRVQRNGCLIPHLHLALTCDLYMIRYRKNMLMQEEMYSESIEIGSLQVAMTPVWRDLILKKKRLPDSASSC